MRLKHNQGCDWPAVLKITPCIPSHLIGDGDVMGLLEVGSFFAEILILNFIICIIAL
jgi:hypothetical protein